MLFVGLLLGVEADFFMNRSDRFQCHVSRVEIFTSALLCPE